MRGIDGFGDRVRERRRARGLSQQRLAEIAGVSFSTVRNWERRGTLPDAPTLVRVTRVLGTSSDYLLGLVDAELDAIEDGVVELERTDRPEEPGVQEDGG